MGGGLGERPLAKEGEGTWMLLDDCFPEAEHAEAHF